MIMSAFGKVDMSSSRMDCRLSQGGPDVQRGQRHDEHEGTERLHVIRQVIEQRITRVEAGTQVGLTDRHVRHLLQRVEQEGNQGLTHRGRGTPSNRRLPETVQATALTR